MTEAHLNKEDRMNGMVIVGIMFLVRIALPVGFVMMLGIWLEQKRDVYPLR
jgi:hypothetical protein